VTTPDDRTYLPDSRPKTDAGWLTSSDAISYGRFAPGTVLAERYRVLGLLGRGGMGEVYRADDLKLGQQVALKFLPRDLAQDPTRLARFHSEVRLSRQISHPNVCRVYDVGEIDGDTFLSMEYVDGEDLASLLRRIGRLPEDTATEMARQLCAGVAAAHARGVLHRDLKPANVMIDGRGSVRVMDFGLAVVTGTAEIDRAGTPAYMAPEQLAGGALTAQSDIYALGLVLYEMFTGRRANNAETLAELIRLHESDTTTRPSTIVPGLDPAIERAILRCLERDAARRPATALAVAAALPGGDPLAAALAAGETPSPAMVAAAGREEAIPNRVALASLAVIAIALVVLPFVFDRVLLLRLIPAPRAVDVLVDRAQTIRRTLGYTELPQDEFYELEEDEGALQHVRSASNSVDRWNQFQSGRPAPVVFWYRSSPRVLAHRSPSLRPSLDDPAFDISGMTTIAIDTQGRLLAFHAVPPQRDAETALATTPDWAPLFAAAELSPGAFRSSTPQWTPITFGDARAAWEGTLPERPDVPIRVEAAAYRGRPVFFQVVGPWTRPTRMGAEPMSAIDRVISIVGSILICGVILGAAAAARHHLRRGRADRRGADRLGLTVVGLYTVAWLLGAHHTGDVETEINGFFLFVAIALLIATMDWLFYLALEPLVRKWDPRALVGWTRLMNGALRDPHVGADVLIGVVAGVLFALSRAPRGLMATLVGGPPDIPIVTSFAPLLGTQYTVSVVAMGVPSAINNAMLLVVAVRYGLLTTITMMFVWMLLEANPLTADPSMRYFATSLWTLAGVFALAVFAAIAARAGQPLFSASSSS
jgi:serine/threonine-protein kinase